MKKTLWMMLGVVLVCALVLAGCTQQQDVAVIVGADEPTEIVVDETITDLSGNEVTIAAADKVVSLTPSGTEILFALGCGDNIVGVDAFSDYPAEAAQKEIVGDFNGPDVEKITALEPDVIFAGTSLQQDAIDQLTELGFAVVSCEATTYDQIKDSIELIGSIMGKTEQAAALNEEIAAAEAEVQEKASEVSATVYYAMSWGDAGNWTSGPGSFINTMIELCGGTCVTENAEYPWVEFPLEDLTAADPDVILMDDTMGSADDLSVTTGYTELTAVQNGKVYAIEGDEFTRPGPRIAQALRTLSEILTGEVQ